MGVIILSNTVAASLQDGPQRSLPLVFTPGAAPFHTLPGEVWQPTEYRCVPRWWLPSWVASLITGLEKPATML